jgi:hypothetical protein
MFAFIFGLILLGVGIYLVYHGSQPYDGYVQPKTYKGFGGCFIAIGVIIAIVDGLRMAGKRMGGNQSPVTVNPVFAKEVPMAVANSVAIHPNGSGALATKLN